jgi:hypothetical protein
VLPATCAPGDKTHPELLRGDRVVPSPAFADPRIFIRNFSAVAPPPLTSASLGFGRPEDLAAVRRFLRTQLARAGFGDEAAALLVAAAAEVVTNALMHGTAPRRLWVYTEGPMLVCHVRDDGPGFADPLAAYLAPDRHATHGHGLWLGRQAFVGRVPPRRVTALPVLRRVRVEVVKRAWLREIGIPSLGWSFQEHGKGTG